MKVYIKTPARLHLGLIDLNGNLDRMFGGVGVGIDQPNVVVEAEPAPKFQVTGQQTDLTTALAKRFFETYKTETGVHLHVSKVIPSHVGLGSGTQLALAVATALAKTFNIDRPVQEFALAMGRCKRTGVGTAIFAQGGLVVDGGKPTQNGQCIPERFPPLIFRQSFPEQWRFIVALPDIYQGLANTQETTAFNRLPPMAAEKVGEMCRLIMFKLLPCMADTDLQGFGEALTRIQIITGHTFSPVQGGTYSNPAIAPCLNYMKQLGVHGVGQSSWGPTLYGVVLAQDAKTACKKVQTYLKKNMGGIAFVAKANNKGVNIKITKRNEQD